MRDVATAVQVRGLRVWFGERHALDGVDLAAPEGRVTVIVGPSGSGKTTLLRAVDRLNECFEGARTEGEVIVRLGGSTHDVRGGGLPLQELRRRVALVFQTPAVLPFTVLRNFEVPLRAVLGLDRTAVRERAEDVLRQVGLWDEVRDRLHAGASTLSIGQQHRLCIARALAMEPEILLLDEPTSSLDVGSARIVEDLLLSFRARYTLVVVTHSLAQARRIADRIVVLRAGRVVAVADRDASGRFPEDAAPLETWFGDDTLNP